MNLDAICQKIILNHCRHPRNRGLRQPFDAEVYHVNPACGDELTLRVKVADGVVWDVSYENAGCSISQASTSIMTNLMIGRSVGEAMQLERAFVALMQPRGRADAGDAAGAAGAGDADGDGEAGEDGGEDDVDTRVLDDAITFAGLAGYPTQVECVLLSWTAWKDATRRSRS